MRAKFVNEQNFERGKDPRQSLGVGRISQLVQETLDKVKEGWGYERADESEKRQMEKEALKDMLPIVINNGNFKDAKMLIEQPEKLYKTRIKGSIVNAVNTRALDPSSDLPQKTEAEVIEFMDYLKSKGAVPEFRRWSAFKDACSLAHIEIIKKFVEDYGANPRLDNEMPMRRLGEKLEWISKNAYNQRNKELIPKVYDCMRSLLDKIKI